MHTELNQTLDTYQTVDKSHGRIETRRLTTSTALNAYVQWPELSKCLSLVMSGLSYQPVK